jgi:predicted nucleotidyltransferase component of viral defense system
MIPQRNLSLLSNRLARAGGRRIPEAVLERDYCIAWFLAVLSGTPLADRLAFKGGTAIKHCYFGDYRFSEDLDFTLVNEIEFDAIRRELDGVFAAIRQGSGIEFRYAREDRHSNANSHTFYLSYEGPLHAAASRKEIKIDITIKERLVFPPVKQPALRVYDEYADLPKDATVHVYTLKEIATEKVVALCDRARNEPRDLYDIWYLMNGKHVDLSILPTAIAEKLAFRKRTLEGIGEELRKKEDRFRKLWDPRLSHQVALLPAFQEVFRAVQREFRRAGLP